MTQCPKTGNACIYTGCENGRCEALERDKPKEHTIFPNYGWICPKCGRGNSPHTSTCPCQPINYTITCHA